MIVLNYQKPKQINITILYQANIISHSFGSTENLVGRIIPHTQSGLVCDINTRAQGRKRGFKNYVYVVTIFSFKIKFKTFFLWMKVSSLSHCFYFGVLLFLKILTMNCVLFLYMPYLVCGQTMNDFLKVNWINFFCFFLRMQKY